MTEHDRAVESPLMRIATRWRRFLHAPLDAVEAERAARLFAGVGLYGPMIVLLLLLGAFVVHPYVPNAAVVAFLLLLLAEVSIKMPVALRYARVTRPPPPFYRHVIVGGSIYSGLVYGAASLVLLLPMPDTVRLLLAAIYAALLSWGIWGMPQSFISSALMSVPIATPVAVALLLSSDRSLVLLGALVVVVTTMGLSLTYRTAAALTRQIELDLENRALLEQLERDRSAIERERRRAEQAVIDKSLFIATASHDLRQPVHALGLFQHALERRRAGSDDVALIDAIGESTASLTALLDGLLDVSSLDARAVEPEWESIDVGRLFAALAREFAPVVASRGLTLAVDGCDAHVFSDRQLLTRVLRNLLSNAVKFCDVGTISLSVSTDAPAGDDGGTPPDVLLVVCDTGPGIPTEEVDRVFAEFYRGRSEAAERASGVGLGLSIVARLCALLDVTLDLASEPGRGTCVRLAVPRAMSTIAGRTASHVPPPSALRLDGTHVLVIDDDAAVRAGMRDALEGQGCRVDLARDTASARACLHETVPDVLLCDHRLGDALDGLSLIASLRAEAGRALPAVIVSGDAPESVVGRSVRGVSERSLDPDVDARGAPDVERLRKPVSPRALFEIVHRLTT